MFSASISHRFSTFCIGAALLLLAAAGCGVDRPKPAVHLHSAQDQAEQALQDISPASQQMHSRLELKPLIHDALRYVSGRPQNKAALDHANITVTWGELKFTLEKLLSLLPALDRDPSLLAEHFSWYVLRPKTLITGYYEPFIPASLEPGPEYPYPLYGLPDDLRKADLGHFNYHLQGKSIIYRMTDEGIEPYYSREDIDEKGVLQGRDLEVAWAKHFMDAFFLQIQGSGRLVLPDGSTKNILYAGKNGLRYKSVGRIMIDMGMLTREEVSMQSIRRYLEEHPWYLPWFLSTNPSYVFFKLADTGPFGASNALLKPYASAAVDRSFLPMGALLFVDHQLPEFQGVEHHLKGPVLTLDTGAMKGNHIDLFCGSDERAEHQAGHMKEKGTVYLLLAKEVTDTD